MAVTFKINREILSEFLPDPESIRQFERALRRLDELSTINASDVVVDTSDFDGHLSSSDDDVQQALETLDELKQFKDGIIVDTFIQVGTQSVSGTDTVTSGVVFCTGSGYTLTMPTGVTGRKVEVFNKGTSGYITIAQVAGEDFDLYYGESLDMTFDGTEWQA